MEKLPRQVTFLGNGVVWNKGKRLCQFSKAFYKDQATGEKTPAVRDPVSGKNLPGEFKTDNAEVAKILEERGYKKRS